MSHVTEHGVPCDFWCNKIVVYLFFNNIDSKKKELKSSHLLVTFNKVMLGV